ncbi:MAG: hypothetical protein HY566_00895, partial [Candidatus Kerfeldbacteria bacterium]|nr:hypothetical protein [Candidatus Kerfeldbacteria bacterium]
GLFSMNGGASTTNLTASGTGYFTTATSTNLFSTNANIGALTAGTLSLTSGTTTNFFSTTASSTNLFSQLATLGVLTLGNALGISSGGTATATQVTNGVNYFDGTRITSGTALTYDGTKFTAPFASSTALSVSGTGYFGTASTTNLTVSSLTLNRVPYVTTAGAFTDSANLTFDGTTLTAANLTSSGNVSLGNATTTNLFSTTASSTNLYSQAAAFGTLSASGATTLSSTLNVTGLSTLGQASTTLFSSYGPAYFGATATSTFTSAGRLGILTASPSYPLEVTGAGRFTSAVDASYFVATTTTATSTFAGGLTVGTNKLVVSNWTSNIGLGTTSPSVALDIASAKTGINIWAATTSGYKKANIGYSDAVATDVFTISTAANVGGTYQDIQILPNGATGNTGLYLNTSGQTGLGYTSFGDTSIGNALLVNGRVGIGTTTPSNALSVVVNGRASGDLRYGLQIVNTDSANTKATNIALLGGGGSAAASGNWFIGTDATHDNSSNFFIATSTGANAYKQFVFNSEGSLQLGQVSSAPSVTTDRLYNLAGGIYWNGTNLTGGVTNYWAHSGSNTYVSTATDNIGIGTSSPYAKLSIHANNGDTNTTLFAIASSTASATTTLFSISNTGALSAGTTTLTNLIVSNTSTSTFAGAIDVNISSGTSTIASNLWVKGTLRTGTGSLYLNDTSLSAANGGFQLNTSATSTFATNGFTVGTSQFVVQQTSGNVGVGTTSPSTTLGVVGSGYFTSGLGVGVLNTAAGTLQTSGAATFGGTLTVNGTCVTADTRLRRRRRRADGTYEEDDVMIKDIETDDEIQSLDMKTGEFVWSRVNALIDTGIQPLVKIRTLSGKEIRTTAVHPYLVRAGEYRTKAAHETQKLYRFEVDMSMKIEAFSADTVVAVANAERSITLTIPRKLKQALRDRLRARAPREFLPAIYALGVVEALKRLDARVHELVIDWDYYSHDDVIARIIHASFPQVNLSFERVGKKSPAHFAAYGVHTKKKIADHTATLKDILQKTESALPASFLPHKGGSSESHQAPLMKKSVYNQDEFVKHGKWTVASELKIGQKIAVAYGKTPAWEKVVEIKLLPEEQVYDVEIEGTHNFVGNGIVAHNTALFNQASTTLFSSYGPAYFGATATSTFGTDGTLTLAKTLAVNGTTGTTTIASGQGFTVGSSQFVVQQGSGNVGIGTTTPASINGQTYNPQLHVAAAAGATGRIVVSGAPAILILNDFSQVADSRLFDIINTGTKMSFRSYNDAGTVVTTSMTLDRSGNVGIGTTGPGGKLDVRDGTFLLTDADVAHGLTGWAPTATYGYLAVNDATGGGLALRGFSDDAAIPGVELSGFIGVADPTDNTPAVIISGAKKNGTGQAALADAETILAVVNAVSQANGGSPTKLVVLGSGNVGIGTTSPQRQLHVNGAGTESQIKISNANTGSASGDGFDVQVDSNQDVYLWQRENHHIYLGTNATTAMTILNSGNVG